MLYLKIFKQANIKIGLLEFLDSWLIQKLLRCGFIWCIYFCYTCNDLKVINSQPVMVIPLWTVIKNLLACAPLPLSMSWKIYQTKIAILVNWLYGKFCLLLKNSGYSSLWLTNWKCSKPSFNSLALIFAEELIFDLVQRSRTSNWNLSTFF